MSIGTSGEVSRLISFHLEGVQKLYIIPMEAGAATYCMIYTKMEQFLFCQNISVRVELVILVMCQPEAVEKSLLIFLQ